MATPVAEIEFIPDEAPVSDPIDFIPDDAPAAEAVDFVPDEVVAEEAQRAAAGALQVVDVMAAPGKLDWSEVNEKLDAERFREANALRADVTGKISTPERRAAFAKSQELLSQISPTTTIGKYLAAQQAGQEQAAIEIGATEERGSTPSSMLSGLVGPGLAPTVMPVVEGAARNAGAAAGGALAAAKFVPGPVGIAARLGPILPIAAGIGGALAGSATQEKLLQTTETPEETSQRQQRAAEDFERNPGLSYLGAMAASAPWFRPGIAQFGRAAAGDKGAILNLGVAGGLGGAMEVGSALARGDTVEARNVAMGIISNLLMNEPTRLGRKIGLKPSTEQLDAESAAMRSEQAPIPIKLSGTDVGLAEAPVAEGDAFAGVGRKPVEQQSVRVKHAGTKDVQFEQGREAWFTDAPEVLEVYTNPEHPLHWNRRGDREMPTVTEAVVTGKFFGARPTDMGTLANSIASKMKVLSEDRGGFWVEAYGQKSYSRESTPEAAIAAESRKRAERLFNRTGSNEEIISVNNWDILNDAGFDAVQTDVEYTPGAKNYVVRNPEQIAKVTEPTSAPTPVPATDEQRIAKLVEAGMSPEDAAAGLARIKALEAPPAAAPKQEVAAKKEVVDEITEELADYTNKESVGVVRKIVTELTEKFEMPGAVVRLNFAGKTKSSAEVFGVYEPYEGGERHTGKSEMAFQDYVFRFTPDEVDRVFRDWGKRTGTVEGGTRALVVHEFGHVIHNMLRHGRTDAEKTRIFDSLKALEAELGSPSKYAEKSISEWLPERLALEDAQGGGKLTDFLVNELRVLKTPPPPVEPPPPTRPTAPEAPQPLDPAATSNKETVVNAERAARQLDPVIKEAAIENPNAIDYAERAIEANPARPQEIVDRLRTNPMERSISVEDAAIMLVERTKIRNTRDAALARMGSSKKDSTPEDRAIARLEFEAAELRLNQMDQAAQDARSTWGRFGQLWQRSMREDFSLANLERRARLSKDGPLTEQDLAGLTAIADKAKKAQDDFDIRQKQLELENRQNAIDSKIAEVSEKAKGVDPAVKSIADRIIARLDVAAKNAEKSLRQKLFNLGAAPDPTIILEVAKIAAARTAKATIEFAQWSAEMVSKFGEKVRPFLQAGWDQREQHIDTAINAGGGAKKAQVAARVKKTGTISAAAQQARVEQAIGNRIAEGKPLSALAPYVNKLQESFISQGITERDALIDAVHGALQKHDPAITRDDAMEIMSKYGADYATPLSKDPVKQTRRQVDGEIQQLLKLRDIAAGVPLPKSGPERPTPGATWRNLIKQVNAAKKKLGVVVTDPETQLKSSQDAIRTRLRNEIEDMTLELETGTRPPEKTPAEYTQDMEILKAVRDRVRETLDALEQKPGLTDAQRLAMTKRAAEDSLAMWERRLAGEAAKQPKKGISTPEIEAIRAKRDAVRAEVEELNAADAVLQENVKAEALVRQIENVEAQLSGSANPRVRIQGADSQLVAEAREQLAALRNALDIKNSMDPQRQLEAIEKAEATLEASIKKLDAQLQAGDISTAPKRTGPQSERLDYLRAQRDAMVKLRSQMRAEARPRLSVDELAIKMRTTQMLKRAAELRQRMATGDFGPRTRKAPVDISGDPKALAAQADLMSVDAEFQKLQEQWKLDQLTGPEKVLRRIGQAWDATANVFLSFDLSTPLQTAFAMASHPIEGAKAIGKGATAFYQQFVKGSDAYAAQEAARIANSINAKNGLYKAMKLELPSALGKKREENMASILEQLADLDARWAGLPDVVKGLFKLEGKTLIKGGKRLASVAPAFVGRGIKASNAAFETIANTMRARTADAMLARWYGRGKGTPTKQQLELLGEQINVATGKGGLRAGDSIRRLLFAPNYYLSILKQLSGWQLGKAAVKLEGQVAKDIATEYIRAVATMGAVYGLAQLFGDRDQMTFDPRDKSFARAKTDRGTSIDITMGRGAWITAAAQIVTGERIDKRGRAAEANRKETALNFAGGRLSRGVATALTTAFGENYKGKPITGIEIAKDFVIPLSWRDFDNLLKREGMTRGSFIQLLNILGVTHKIAD